MSSILGYVVLFAIGYLVAYLALLTVTKMFFSNVDPKELAGIVLLMQIVGLLGYIPFIGGILVIIINTAIMSSVLESNFLVGFFAVILWGIVQVGVWFLLGATLLSAFM
jgi:hypothetical protein